MIELVNEQNLFHRKQLAEREKNLHLSQISISALVSISKNVLLKTTYPIITSIPQKQTFQDIIPTT